MKKLIAGSRGKMAFLGLLAFKRKTLLQAAGQTVTM